jgi:DNA polymerase-1
MKAYEDGLVGREDTLHFLGMPAKEIIDNYYKQFSGITEWKRQVVASGRSKGYVTTISGRRRRLPELNANDDTLRSRAERQAVNAVVQGSAADICKEAMININELLRGTGASLLVQVHDELVVAVPEEIIEELTPKFMDAMGHGRIIDGVPLLVSADSAYSWADAK